MRCIIHFVWSSQSGARPRTPTRARLAVACHLTGEHNKQHHTPQQKTHSQLMHSRKKPAAASTKSIRCPDTERSTARNSSTVSRPSRLSWSTNLNGFLSDLWNRGGTGREQFLVRCYHLQPWGRGRCRAFSWSLRWGG